jgi:hypothetical protein
VGENVKRETRVLLLLISDRMGVQFARQLMLLEDDRSVDA